jgi:hypothetical protein
MATAKSATCNAAESANAGSRSRGTVVIVGALAITAQGPPGTVTARSHHRHLDHDVFSMAPMLSITARVIHPSIFCLLLMEFG